MTKFETLSYPRINQMLHDKIKSLVLTVFVNDYYSKMTWFIFAMRTLANKLILKFQKDTDPLDKKSN